jgi:thioredoxin 1
MPILDLDHATDARTVRARLNDGVPLIACLCAEWCGACREYRDVFEQLSNAHPTLCFVWIDIENQAEVSDLFDVENFPTIVIEDRTITRFSGTLLPQRGILERLLEEFPKLSGTGETAALRRLLAE